MFRQTKSHFIRTTFMSQRNSQMPIELHLNQLKPFLVQYASTSVMYSLSVYTPTLELLLTLGF